MTYDASRLPGPPRQVPLGLRLQVLLGGPLGLIGWIFAAFGSIFPWVFVPQADLSFVRFRGPTGVAEGVVVGVGKTGAKENNRRVWKLTYRFTDPAGVEREGASFSLGQEPDAGGPARVEFLLADPGVSRIEGLRMAPFSPWVGFVALFPAVGLLLALGGLKQGLTSVGLMAEGELARGRLRGKEPTNTRINDRTVYALTFAFTDLDGREQTVTERTHTPERLQDEAEELLVYDPSTPSRAVLVDNLPGRPRLDLDQGVFVGGSRGLLTLLLPAAFVLVNAVGVVWACL
jgi:hypothetical protein